MLFNWDDGNLLLAKTWTGKVDEPLKDTWKDLPVYEGAPLGV